MTTIRLIVILLQPWVRVAMVSTLGAWRVWLFMRFRVRWSKIEEIFVEKELEDSGVCLGSRRLRGSQSMGIE